jgi:hypothetical protein
MKEAYNKDLSAVDSPEKSASGHRINIKELKHAKINTADDFQIRDKDSRYLPSYLPKRSQVLFWISCYNNIVTYMG